MIQKILAWVIVFGFLLGVSQTAYAMEITALGLI